jgi:hypothetical protein
MNQNTQKASEGGYGPFKSVVEMTVLAVKLAAEEDRLEREAARKRIEEARKEREKNGEKESRGKKRGGGGDGYSFRGRL